MVSSDFETVRLRLSKTRRSKLRAGLDRPNEPAALRVILYQVISTILFAMLAPGFFQSSCRSISAPLKTGELL